MSKPFEWSTRVQRVQKVAETECVVSLDFAELDRELGEASLRL